MRHCTPDELMDVIEGARTEASLPHLAACEVCREHLMEVGAVLAEVSAVSIPEPSPVQWATLGARIHDAVVRELGPSRGRWWKSPASWMWQAPVAAAAVLTLIIVFPRAPWTHKSGPDAASSASIPVGPAGGTSHGAIVFERAAADPGNDPSLGLMFDLAEMVDLDADPAPVLAMSAGAVDQAVDDLSSDERHELARLLKEAIERAGA
jgi:hypothetical protein